MNKFTISGDIPTKILKHYPQIFSKKLVDIFNESRKLVKFSEILKKTEVTPVSKMDDINDKQNHRPISTLSNPSKAFKKLIYSHIYTYMR